MTKHDPVETGLKCLPSIEESNRVDLNVNDLVAENVAKLYSSRVFMEQEPKLKAIHVKKTRATKRTKLSRVTQRLYNLESGSQTETPLHIELDLYQMESF